MYLSRSFSAPFSLLSLSLPVFYFFRSCSPAIDRFSWLEVNPRRTPDSFVHGGYRGDPPRPRTHRGLVRGQTETISPLQSDEVKGHQRTVRSMWMLRLLGAAGCLISEQSRCVMDWVLMFGILQIYDLIHNVDITKFVFFCWYEYLFLNKNVNVSKTCWWGLDCIPFIIILILSLLLFEEPKIYFSFLAVLKHLI